MKRNTAIVGLVIGLLAVSGVLVGAAGFDNLFANESTVEDDTIVLTPADTAAGNQYAEINNGNLSINITDLNGNANVTINDVFKAQYNGTQEGYIYFDNNNPDVTIIDSAGNPVESSGNSVNFTSQYENETFGVILNATDTNSVSLTNDQLGVVAGAKQNLESTPGDPDTYSGSLNDSDGVDAPKGVTVYAVVNGTVKDSNTTVEVGTYDQGPLKPGLVFSEEAGTEVNFTVFSKDGPEALNSPYSHESGDNNLDLTFPSGTFSSELNVSIDESQSNLSVTSTENVSVTFDVINTGPQDLTETVTANVSNNGQQASTTVSVGARNTTTETLEFAADSAFDGETVNVSAESGNTSTASLSVTSADVATVNSISVDKQYVGVAKDDGSLSITADVENSAGNAFTGTATVSLNDSTGTSYDIESVDVNSGTIDTTVDPTKVSEAVSVGSSATIELDGVSTSATVTPLHEVQLYSANTVTASSVPQAGQMYWNNSDWSAVQWDESTQRYSAAGFDASGSFTSAQNLHRGLFVLTSSDVRIGYEYQTTTGSADGSTFTLQSGWNLVGSNYNISSGTVDLQTDLGTNFDTVVDANTGSGLSNATTINAYDAYWVYMNNQQDRTVVAPGYDAAARAGQ